MDISLATYSEDKILKLCNVEHFSDGSGYKADLYVKSRDFSAEIPFYFEDQPLITFVANLEKMNSTLTGTALLKPLFEGNCIEFRINNTGHVNVLGHLVEYSEMSQSMDFQFQTDQTCLIPFVRELKILEGLHAHT